MIDALLRTVMVVALVATGAAALAILLGAAGLELLSVPHAVVLIGAGAISFMGFLVLQLMAQHRYGTKQFNALLKPHAPQWMRWLCIGLGLASAALWFFLAYRRYEPPAGGVSSLMAGAFLLCVAPAAFLAFYSYLGLRPELRRRCSRGHEMPVGASYCPQCGEQVQPVERRNVPS